LYHLEKRRRANKISFQNKTAQLKTDHHGEKKKGLSAGLIGYSNIETPFKKEEIHLIP